MYRIKVETLQELPLFIWGQERVLHELLESFKALNIYADSILVALRGTVESVLFGVADTTKEAHGRFEATTRGLCIGSSVIMDRLVKAVLSAACGSTGLCFALIARATVGYQMRGIVLSKCGECLLEARLFDEAVTSEVSAGRVASNEVLLDEKGMGTSIVASRKIYLGQPECVGIVI